MPDSSRPYRTRRTLKPSGMDAARAIPRALLLEILEDANWAPTHGLTQPWRFHVFTGAARVRLAETLESLYDRLTAVGARRDDKRAKLRVNALGAPVVVAVAANIDPAGKISELDEIAATACAVQNLMLSAHQHGVGSFWSTAPITCSAEFLHWLGLDATHRGMGIVYLGHPQIGRNPVSSRLPLAARVVFHDE